MNPVSRADDYVRTGGDRPEAEPLAMIPTYLRSDRGLSPEAAAALDDRGYRLRDQNIEDEAEWSAGTLLLTEDAALHIARNHGAGRRGALRDQHADGHLPPHHHGRSQANGPGQGLLDRPRDAQLR